MEDPTLSLFAGLYKSDPRQDKKLFGDYYVGQDADFSDREWHKVAFFPKTEGSDGQPCEIWELRMPARFYKLKALESTNSVDEMVPAWALSTGSGMDMAMLMIQLALKTAQGMIGKADDDE